MSDIKPVNINEYSSNRYYYANEDGTPQHILSRNSDGIITERGTDFMHTNGAKTEIRFENNNEKILKSVKHIDAQGRISKTVERMQDGKYIVKDYIKNEKYIQTQRGDITASAALTEKEILKKEILELNEEIRLLEYQISLSKNNLSKKTELTNLKQQLAEKQAKIKEP